MEFIRKHIKFVYILVLPVYFYIIQHSILNKHTHVFSNGIVVTHSHAKAKDSNLPINAHSHSKSEIQLFCDLSVDFHFVPDQAQVDRFIPEISANFLVEDEQAADFSFPLCLVSRGPPLFQNV